MSRRLKSFEVGDVQRLRLGCLLRLWSVRTRTRRTDFGGTTGGIAVGVDVSESGDGGADSVEAEEELFELRVEKVVLGRRVSGREYDGVVDGNRRGNGVTLL